MYDKKWLIDSLRRLGYTEEVDAAAQELPEQVSEEQLRKFANRFGISRDELINRMGGSP